MDSNIGRIIEVFGGELWFKVVVDLFDKFSKECYKKFILESLDTENKSTEYLLDILEHIIEETKHFFKTLRVEIFKENGLDLD